MVVCGILGVIITLVNLTVILVHIFKPAFLHSQGVYKVSLAFADILVGIVVFPTLISNLLLVTTGRQKHADYVDVIGYETIDGNLSRKSSVVQVRAPGGRLSDFFHQTYLDIVGFFTILSLSVSIYNLTVAGFDRFKAVNRPLSYQRDKAKTFAKRACLVLWSIGILFAVLPTFVPSLRYWVTVSIFVASTGQDALILYVITFAIPTVLMWVVNIVMFHSEKKHAKVRRDLMINSNQMKSKVKSVEYRLARTLSIMVGVFTLSILPAILVIIPSLFVSSIYYSNPRTFDMQGAIVYNAFEFASFIILACNSLWNFFIYHGQDREFRKAVIAMYSRKADCNGFSHCGLSLRACAQVVVHDGQRRISSISDISTIFTKKSSLVLASTISINSKTKSSTSSFNTAEESPSSRLKNSKSKTMPSDETSTDIEGSEVESSRLKSADVISVTSQRNSTKKEAKGKKKKSKKYDDISVSKSPVFQSRLFMSVMEQIDEEIVDAEADEQTK